MAEVSDVDPESFSIPLRTSAHPPLSVGASDADPERSSVPVGRSIMGTSWKKAGVEPWDALGPVTSDTQDIRGAFGEGYRSVPESISRPGQRSMFTPEAQTSISQWPYGIGAVTNAVGDVVGTAAGGAAGVGNSALALGNQALKSVGLPPALIRDINVGATNAPFAPELRLPPELRPGIKPADAPGMREMMQPPAPSLPAVLRQQRSLLPPDPATLAAIDILRRATGSPDMPTPPTPFRGAPYQPPPSGGLLDISAPPAGGQPTIMTPAEIQARAGSLYKLADQAAARSAMLPDANASAVRKLFSDAVPSDPEQARFAAEQPAVQAAMKVDPTGPMSFDTAMTIDRDLTTRLRRASGEDAHDVSQLQQKLRDQMDQVPDLDNLRPGRLAYTQYIKQSAMDDINYGASFKNDPAAKDAYVRQRAAALLKDKQAMRNWTPEETAQLDQVARSGDIGMLGRLSVSLVKPTMRAVGAGIGSIAGVPGALVGSEIGGDVGATQAAKLRSYLSKTTLDPVMQQITLGVPPPPRQ